MKTILFDLDGTLTESGIGITRSAAYALDQLGIPHPAPEELSVFVGPPLRKTFPEFGVKEEDVDQAIQTNAEGFERKWISFICCN